MLAVVVETALGLFAAGYRLETYEGFDNDPMITLTKGDQTIIDNEYLGTGSSQVLDILGLSGEEASKTSWFLAELTRQAGFETDSAQALWVSTVIETAAELLSLSLAAVRAIGHRLEVYQTDTNKVSARIDLEARQVRWGQKSPSQDW